MDKDITYEQFAKFNDIQPDEVVLNFDPAQAKYLSRYDDSINSRNNDDSSKQMLDSISFEDSLNTFDAMLRKMRADGEVSNRARVIKLKEFEKPEKAKQAYQVLKYAAVVGSEKDINTLRNFFQEKEIQYLTMENQNQYQARRDDHQAIRMMAILGGSTALSNEDKDKARDIHDNSEIETKIKNVDLVSVENLDYAAQMCMRQKLSPDDFTIKGNGELYISVENPSIEKVETIVDVFTAAREAKRVADEKIKEEFERTQSSFIQKQKDNGIEDVKTFTIENALENPNFKELQDAYTKILLEVFEREYKDVQKSREYTRAINADKEALRKADEAKYNRMDIEAKSDDYNGASKMNSEYILNMITDSAIAYGGKDTEINATVNSLMQEQDIAEREAEAIVRERKMAQAERQGKEAAERAAVRSAARAKTKEKLENANKKETVEVPDDKDEQDFDER